MATCLGTAAAARETRMGVLGFRKMVRTRTIRKADSSFDTSEPSSGISAHISGYWDIHDGGMSEDLDGPRL